MADAHGLTVRSMGMSADFEAAIAAGATHIRVGTAIFGAREARCSATRPLICTRDRNLAINRLGAADVLSVSAGPSILPVSEMVLR